MCTISAKAQRSPAIHYRKIGRIIKRHAIPVQLPLPITYFHQFEDAYQARWTVVRMYTDAALPAPALLPSRIIYNTYIAAVELSLPEDNALLTIGNNRGGSIGGIDKRQQKA
ncbi:MAG: hypothetical protein M1118_16080 [Chloroflexi bacterium]|nr:hypothetical protein [Chloroflexota bacterium]